MPEFSTLSLYLGAAVILAITPGPGILYVLTRSIKGGRSEGYFSAFGTAVGGLFHVIAAALGLSAILAASALAFDIVRYVGAAYLIYLGIRALTQKDDGFEINREAGARNQQAFRQGILTEILNPKTALFFLAFIPQFINPNMPVVPQFIVLGCISVFLNTSVDVIVASLAGPIGTHLQKRARLRKAQRVFSGCSLLALGAHAAISGGKQPS
jgi:threonine/homoserine/homoserine lactone efflux protein